jgi:hypothetical protein
LLETLLLLCALHVIETKLSINVLDIVKIGKIRCKKHLKKGSDDDVDVTPIYMSFYIIQKEIRKV